MKKSTYVLALAGTCVTAAALYLPACSTKKDAAATPTINQECRVGAGTSLTLTNGDGTTTDVTPWGCYIQGPTSSGGQFFAFKYLTKDGGDGMVLVDLQPSSDGSTAYTNADVGDDLPPTNGFAPATAPASIKLWISSSASKSAPWDWWTTTAGGTVTVTNQGGWPAKSATGAATAAIEWVSAPMKVRPCAHYAPAGLAYCGPTGGTTGSDAGTDSGVSPPETKPGFVKGTLVVRFGATAEECNPASGGAACTEIAACDADPQCTCEHATCNAVGAPDGGMKCCIQNGLPCGTAGGGADCCSGFCGSSGTCVAQEEKPSKCSQPAADGGDNSDSSTTIYFGCTESGNSCTCGYSGSPPPLKKCQKSYPCCVGFSPSDYESPSSPLYGQVGLCGCIDLPTSDPNCHLTGQTGGIWNHSVASCP